MPDSNGSAPTNVPPQTAKSLFVEPMRATADEFDAVLRRYKSAASAGNGAVLFGESTITVHRLRSPILYAVVDIVCLWFGRGWVNERCHGTLPFERRSYVWVQNDTVCMARRAPRSSVRRSELLTRSCQVELTLTANANALKQLSAVAVVTASFR